MSEAQRGVEMGTQSGLRAYSQPSTETVHSVESSSPRASSRPVSPSVAADPPPVRAPCSNLLKGQFLSGEYSVYDIDKQLPGEVPEQLEVLPISAYRWDPALVAGRQIAVNRRYICYCLRPGSIRILGRNVASRGLFEGHSQRVTDMSFFAENVHLIASTSSDGRLLVWKILEDPGADGKFQLSEQIVMAIQFDGEWKDVRPRLCWHSHSQECLVMSISKYVLKIDLSEVRKASSVTFAAETPLKCQIMNLISGVQLIGQHDDEVADLSLFSRDFLFIASASKDGMVQIWGGRKMDTLAVFIPHEGQPVGSVAFVSPPNQPDQAVLLTGGPINHNLKLWIPGNAEGSLDSNMWRSVQTLEFKSSDEGNVEQAFSNQVCVIPQAGLVLLGNSKKHALYSIHLDFGSSAWATRMDYLVEFSMSMPILSLTAMADIVVNCKGIVQVFCVQTQVIQQYFLNVSLCIPSKEEESCFGEYSGLGLSTTSASAEAAKGNKISEVKVVSTEERSEAGNSGLICEHNGHNLITDSGSGFGSWVEVPNWVAATLKKTMKSAPAKEVTDIKENPLTRSLSPLAFVSKSPHGASNDLQTEGRSLNLPPGTHLDEISGGCRSLNAKQQFSPTLTLLPEEEDKSKVTEDAVVAAGAVTLSSGNSSHIDLQTRSELVTPSELMAMACFEAAAVVADKLSRSARQEEASVVLHAESGNLETRDPMDSCLDQSETCPIASMQDRSKIIPLDAGQYETQRETHSQLHASVLGTRVSAGISEHETVSPCQLENVHQEKIDPGAFRKESTSIFECPPGTAMHTSNAKKKRNKNKNRDTDTRAPTIYGSLSMPVSVGEDTSQVLEEREEYSEGRATFPGMALEDLAVQVFTMQESFDQLLATQKELQRDVALSFATPFSTEIKQMESAFEQSLGNSLKVHMDSFWSQTHNIKREEAAFQQEHFQHLTSFVTNSVDRDVVSALDHVLKTEMTSIGSRIAQLASLNVDTVTTTALSKNLEGLHEKIIGQLQRSLSGVLDSLVPAQFQNHFMTSGKHSLQDYLCGCFEKQAFPRFQSFCDNMSEQAYGVLCEELPEFVALVEQQVGSTSSARASSIKDILASSLSTVAFLKGELQDGETRIQDRAEYANAQSGFVNFGGIQNAADFQEKVPSLKHSSSMSYDITANLTRLVQECQFEEAFKLVLSLGDVTFVSWLCKQVDPRSLFAVTAPPLSQGVLLLLVQQLGSDLGNDTFEKLIWIQQASLALNPNDQVLGSYMRSFLEQLYMNLERHMLFFSTDANLANQARLVMHVINSLLTTCK